MLGSLPSVISTSSPGLTRLGLLIVNSICLMCIHLLYRLIFSKHLIVYSATFCFRYTLFSSFNSGSFFSISFAASDASFNVFASVNTSAIPKSKSPLCLTPKKSPGPRSLKSSSAILNPSLDLLRISSLFLIFSDLLPVTNIQYD